MVSSDTCTRGHQQVSRCNLKESHVPILCTGSARNQQSPFPSPTKSASTPVPGETRLALTSLDATVSQFYRAALTASTQRTYQSGKKRYISFCVKYKVEYPIPVSEKLLCYFVSFLAKEGLAHSTIKSYLSAVRHLQISLGHEDPFVAHWPRLEHVTRGIKVCQGREGRTPRRKLPITPEILRRLRTLWNSRASEFDITMLWAACLTCFFGFMRSGEITIPTRTSFDPTAYLSFEDVAMNIPQRTPPLFN